MAQNQTLVPDLSAKTLLILGAIVLATVGLFERRTKFTLDDGTVITGKVKDEDETSKLVERASGYRVSLDRSRIVDEKWFNVEFDLNLGLDLKGGTMLRYRVDLEDIPADRHEDTIERTIDTYRARLDNLGVKELSTRGAGRDEIIIELPGVSMEESQSYENVVMSLGRLEFRIVAEDRPGVVNLQEKRAEIEAYLKKQDDENRTWTPRSVNLSQFDVPSTGGLSYRWYPWSTKELENNPSKQAFPFVLLEVSDDASELITGEDIEDTFPSTDDAGRPALGFEIKSARASDFGEFTEKNKGRQMAIVIDGEVETAPVLNSRIDRNGIIEGGGSGFNTAEVKELRTVLSSGSLQVKPEKLSKATIGPTLGEASIRRGIVAGIVASILIVAFMLVYYRRMGVISCLTLGLGMYMMIGGLGFIEATLTLPGIAGIMLTVGMAVDQNILINERIYEEREKGKTIAQSIKNGFERAFVTIVDAQATTFIAGFILFRFGSGPIRGFAVTLMLGILTTMFASLVGSKVLFAYGLARDRIKSLKVLRIVGETNIQFTKYLRASVITSTGLIVAGLAVFAYDYKALQGLDFAGGFQASVRFTEPQQGEQIKDILDARWDGVQVVSMLDVEGDAAADGGTRNFRITIRSTGDDAAAANEDYVAALHEMLGDKMVPDAVADLEVVPDGDRTNASFTLHFTGPVAQEVIEGRLQEQLTVVSIVPTNGTSPTDSYDVAVQYNVPASKDKVRGEATASLIDLPGGVRLSDPIPESEFISGRVGKELTDNAIKAIVVAIFFILIYIRIRFADFTWGIAACVATVHDVLFGLGAVALVHMTGLVNIELDLTMVGAFLTIVGYSLNDTIVIFDRVRENLPRVNKPLAEVINLSTNQTLARTILTSLTTLMAVIVLFVVNYGQRNVLEGFAFVIIIGVAVGTYSTVFIASPMLLWLTARAEKKSGKRMKYGSAVA